MKPNLRRDLDLADQAEPAVELDGACGDPRWHDSLELGQVLHAQVVNLLVALEQRIHVGQRDEIADRFIGVAILHLTMLFAQGPKSPHGQTASNDHRNRGGGDRYVEASDMHCPSIHSTYSLKHSDHAEEDT